MTEKKLAEARKADVILSDGLEVFFDFDKVTYEEVQSAFDGKNPSIRTDETIAKAAGMGIDSVKKRPSTDYKKMGKAFYKAWLNWQDDPND